MSSKGLSLYTCVWYDSVRNENFKVERSEQEFDILLQEIENLDKNSNKEQTIARLARDKINWTFTSLQFLGLSESAAMALEN